MWVSERDDVRITSGTMLFTEPTGTDSRDSISTVGHAVHASSENGGKVVDPADDFIHGLIVIDSGWTTVKFGPGGISGTKVMMSDVTRFENGR